MRRSERGFTLVELMISLVMFSFAIAGILSVAVSMAQGAREQRQAVGTQDAARAAMDFLADAIRSASPAVATGAIEDFASCKKTAFAVVNSTTGPDQLDLVFASGGVVTATSAAFAAYTAGSITVVDASQIAVGDGLIVTDGTTGHLIVVSAITGSTLTYTPAACVPTTFPGTGYPANSLVIRGLRARFSVGTFDGMPNILLMDPDADGPATAVPLAENIGDFQVALGMDVDGNGSIGATEWQYSPAFVGPPIATIRAIRISVIAQTASQLMGRTAAFLRPAAEDHPAATTADNYPRRLLTSTVEVRNLGGSP
jgi:prepilin-type N-terminal cleavage/methylation domain-containing protein